MRSQREGPLTPQGNKRGSTTTQQWRKPTAPEQRSEKEGDLSDGTEWKEKGTDRDRSAKHERTSWCCCGCVVRGRRTRRVNEDSRMTSEARERERKRGGR